MSRSLPRLSPSQQWRPSVPSMLVARSRTAQFEVGEVVEDIKAQVLSTAHRSLAPERIQAVSKKRSRSKLNTITTYILPHTDPSQVCHRKDRQTKNPPTHCVKNVAEPQAIHSLSDAIVTLKPLPEAFSTRTPSSGDPKKQSILLMNPTRATARRTQSI